MSLNIPDPRVIADRLFALPIAQTIVWLDGPVCWITGATPISPQRFLALFVDDDEEGKTYLFSPLSDTHLSMMGSDNLSLRTAIVASAGPSWAVTVSPEGVGRASAVEPYGIPERWLPSASAA